MLIFCNAVKSVLAVGVIFVLIGCSDDDSNSNDISPESDLAYEGYNYRSHFIDVSDDVRVHYLDEGEGDPILLIHGVPTSAYLWRDVIPHLLDNGRVIAVDLVNFGKSSKVQRYELSDQVAFLTSFVDQLELNNVKLVLHDYGGPVGLSYAAKNPHRVSGLALFETAFAPFPSADALPPSIPIARLLSTGGRELATETDFWIGTVMANNQFNDQPEPAFDEKFVIKNITEVAYQEYLSPFQTVEDREVLFQFAFSIGFLDQPGPVLDDWLQLAQYASETAIPKLVLFGNPGLVPADFAPIDPATGEPFSDPTNGNLLTTRNIVQSRVLPDFGGWRVPATVVDLSSETKHFFQEDAPEELGAILSDWLEQNFDQ
ncbi:MAG: alpha/beta fold hydrolase [Pseudomonadales bacterium]|nr:alpha/beta fold hydrolase [Pseudomonadales bacterium]